MEKKYPTKIGELLSSFMGNNDAFVKGAKEATIMRSWSEVVGSDLAQYTSKLYIRNRKLYVSFLSSSARTVFLQRRKDVLYRLNGIIGEKYLLLIIVVG